MPQPFLSIIVPTHNRHPQLAICLQALVSQSYPGSRFEVIVVDDGGLTSPEAVVASFRDQLKVKLLSQPNAGPAAARNTGAAQAHGRFLAFTDDDCIPDPNWLQALAARLAAGPDGAVGGCTINALPDNPYATVSQLIVDMVYAHYNHDPLRARFFATNNLALPADRFHLLGGFDAVSFQFASEDRDFCDRWLLHGNRMIYAPEAVVYHAHALRLRTFWRQHLRYGQGAFRFHKARARRHTGHSGLEIAFYLRIPELLREARSPLPGRRSLLLASLLALWQVANTAGFLWGWTGHVRGRLASLLSTYR